MIIYIIVFLITCLACVGVEKFKDRKIKILLSVIAILIPSVLAGIRSTKIGTDVNIYVTPMFNLAKSCSSFLEFVKLSETEFGYSVLMYIVAYFTSNVNWILFITSAITVGGVYFFAYDKKDKNPIWLTMLVFLFIMYNMTLNLMRQSMAIAIILVSLCKFEKKEWIPSLIFYLIALLFHNSVIFALPLYLIIFLVRTDKILLRNKIKTLFFTLCTLFIFCIFYEQIIQIFGNVLHIIPQKYVQYFSTYTQKFNINFFEVLYKITWLGLIIYALKKENKNLKEEIPYLIFLLIDFVIFPLSFKIKNSDRLGYYYYWPALLRLVPVIRTLDFKNEIFDKIINNKTLKKIWDKIINNEILNKVWDKIVNKLTYVFIIFLLYVYWLRIYVILGFNETFPYASDIIHFIN